MRSGDSRSVLSAIHTRFELTDEASVEQLLTLLNIFELVRHLHLQLLLLELGRHLHPHLLLGGFVFDINVYRRIAMNLEKDRS